VIGHLFSFLVILEFQAGPFNHDLRTTLKLNYYGRTVYTYQIHLLRFDRKDFTAKTHIVPFVLTPV
jgi:hypothetical protein